MLLQIFDVEHGQCALLTCDNGVRMLIDCGHKDDWRPGDYLASIGVRSLDWLVVTNYDEDHVSGLPNLLRMVHVRWLLRNPTVSAATLKLLKSEQGAGPGIEALVAFINGTAPSNEVQPNLDGATWSAFWNNYPSFNDENNLSLVLHLNVKGVGFMFPGDLETAGWAQLLAGRADLQALAKQTHVLVAAHHGRESGICEDLFDLYGCKPQVVVISDDYHRYDTQKTTSYYYSKCSGIQGFRNQGERRVLTTRNDGTITFNWWPRGCIVS